MTDYDAIQALNWSTLKHLAVSPKMLKFRASVPREDTEALALGRAIHCALLEPDRWRSDYIARPDFGDGRTKVAKEAKAAWEADRNPRAEVLDIADYDVAERCAEAIREHPAAMKIIVGGRSEEIVRWSDPDTGIACKARMDNIRPNDLSDIKSTRFATPREFLRSASSLLYHGQLSWYHDGATAAGLLSGDSELPGVVAVQTTPPHDVWPFRMQHDAYWAGQRLWQSLMRRYAECQAADWWPGAAPHVLDFTVMPWAQAGDDDEQTDEEKW